MAETHQEIFRAKISLELPNLGSMIKAVTTAKTTVRDFADTGEMASVATGKMTETIKRHGLAATEFTGLMRQASEQTKGWREGLSLSGDRLLGLRVALDGTSGATRGFTKAIDAVRKVTARFADDRTREEKSLVKSAEAFQKRTIALRNAARELGKMGEATGVARSDVNQLTEAIRQQMNATRQQTQSAIANGKITDHGIAQIRNSITVMREQLAHFKEHIAFTEDGAEVYGYYIEQLEEYISQSEREAEVLSAKNKSAKKSREEQEKSTQATKSFVERLRQSISGLSLFKRTTDASSRSTRSMGESVRSASSSILKLTGAFTAANLASDAIRSQFNKLTGSVSTFKREFLGLGVIDDMLSSLAQGPVELAARVDTLRTTLGSVGEQAGFSLDFLRQRVDQLRESGITSQASLEAMLKTIAVDPRLVGTLNETKEFSQSLLDTASAAESSTEQLKVLFSAYEEGSLGLGTLSKSAQNLAAAMGGESSQNLQNFITSINRGSTEMLEASGIATNASEMWGRFADVMNELNPNLGLTADNMTQTQKSTAVMLGIIQETLPYASAYDAAMGSIGKQMGSMKRIVEEAKLALGELFLPVLGQALVQLREFLDRLVAVARSDAAKQLAQSLTELLSKLNPIGAGLRFLVDNFEYFAGVLTSVIRAVNSLISMDFAGFENSAIDAIAHLALFFQDKIAGAVNWGWNLIANLANGIIEGAQSVLVSALNAVGDLIGLFFAPGSPPQEGPLSQIVNWGTGLAEEFGGGFTAGVPGAFSKASGAVAGALGKTFRDLDLSSFAIIRESLGPIRGLLQSLGEGAGGPGQILEIRDLMVQLANQFEDTGEISEDVLSKIGDRFGEAGEDVKEYIRLQFDLQKARDDLKKIDEEIADAEAAGFVPAALRDKRKAAVERIDELEDQFNLQRELISWQQESNDLMKEQLNLLKRIADQNERSAKAATGGRGAGLDVTGLAEGASAARQAFIDMANASVKKVGDVRETIGGVTEEFAEMRGKVVDVIDSIKEFFRIPLTQHLANILKWIKDKIPSGVDKLAKQVREKLGSAFSFVSGNLPGLLGGGLAAGLAGGAALGKAAPLLGGLLTTLTRSPIGALLGKLVAGFAKLASVLLGPLLGALKGFVGLIVGALGPVGAIVLAIGAAIAIFVLFKDRIAGIADGIKSVLVPVINVAIEIFKRLYGLVKVVVSNIIAAFQRLFERLSQMESIRRLAERLWPVLKVLATVAGVVLFGVLAALSGVIEGVSRALVPLADFIADVIDWIARLATVILDSAIKPFEILWTLVTKGPKEALGVMREWAGDVIDLITTGLATIAKLPLRAFEIGANLLIGFLDGVVGMITGKFGAVTDFFDGLGEKIVDFANTALDKMGVVGDVLQSAGRGGGQALDWLGRKFGLVKDEAVSMADVVTTSFSGSMDSIKNASSQLGQAVSTAMSQATAAAQENEYARVIVGAMQASSSEVNRLLGEQVQADITYREDRSRLLKEGNAEELVEVSKRYEEEKAIRRQAIAEALLDLNERILKEKLAMAGLTGADAAAIVAQHQQQAQQIADHYQLEIDAAQRMSSAATDALRGASIANADFLTQAGVTLPQALTLFDRLQTEGYAGLSTQAQQSINELVVGMALWQQKNGESIGAISQTLQALPLDYQQSILNMMDANTDMETILGSLNMLDKTVEPKVKVKMEYDRYAEDPLALMSPKTQLQHALENLTAFTEDNPINVQMYVTEGAVEAVTAIIAGITEIGETFPVTEGIISSTAMKISDGFSDLRAAVTGPTGSMRRMFNEIRSFFQGLSSTFGFLGQFKSQVVALFDKMGSEAIIALANSMSHAIRTLFGAVGIPGTLMQSMYDWGKDLMEALGLGIADGIIEYVTPKLESIETPDVPEPKGTRTFGLSLDGLRAGLPTGTVDRSRNASIVMQFDEGAFAGAFPSVTDSEGVKDALSDALNDLMSKSVAYNWVGT